MSGEGEFPVNSLRVCINRRKEDNEVEGFLCSIALKDILHFTGKIEFENHKIMSDYCSP